MSKMTINLLFLALISSLGLLVWQTIRIANLKTDLATTIASNEIERTNAYTQLAIANGKLRQKEQETNEATANIQREANEMVHTIASQRDDLIRRLRIAEAKLATDTLVSRTTKDSNVTEAGSRDNESLIPATIGVEDVEEASRADVIRTHLLACYQQYEAIKEAYSTQDTE